MDADLFADDGPPTRAGPWQRWRQHASAWRWPDWLGTLKARLALGGLAALLFGMFVTAWQLSERAERHLLERTHAREQAEAERTAADIQRRLVTIRHRLGHLARQVEPALLQQPQALVRLLAQGSLPDDDLANLFVAHPDGGMLALVDQAGPRFPGQSLADRDYFREALATRLPVISAPVAGRISGEPVVVLVHPVVQEGQVIALIGGALRLASRDLLRELAGTRPEEDPARVIVTDAHGTVLAHPERGRVMQSLVNDPSMAQAFMQWQAYGRPLLRQGKTWTVDGQVMATAGDGLAGWQVWRALPEADLLAPLREARNLALRDAAVMAGAMSLAMLLFLVWQFRPLARLERRAAALLAGDATGDWPQAGGEIGRLSRTLQHVWAERTQMESFNDQVLRKLGSVMAAAPVGLTFTRNQHFELVSAEFCHLLGYEEADIVGQRAQIIFSSNEDYAALGPQVGEAFARGLPYSGEWQMLRADGSRFWGLVRARPVQPGNPAAGTIWSINDVSDQVATRRELEHAAHHDALTGVVNRQGFDRALQAVYEQQPGSRPAALVMIDLDHFKPLNDAAGHAAGDAMLVAVAQAIASRVRATDLVVRLGGDEFALLLTRCTHERALAVAEKVREAITDLALTWEAHTLRVGASLGVAELAEHHTSPAQWLAQADAALYDAKRAGRGTVRLGRGQLRVVPGDAKGTGTQG